MANQLHGEAENNGSMEQRRQGTDAGPPTMPSFEALGGWVLDFGAMAAYAQDDPFVLAVVASCHRRGQTVLLCDTSIIAAMSGSLEEQKRLRFLQAHPGTWVAELTAADPAAVAALLPRSGGDLGLAHLVYEAARRGYAVLSDRRADILAVDRSLLVEAA